MDKNRLNDFLANAWAYTGLFAFVVGLAVFFMLLIAITIVAAVGIGATLEGFFKLLN